MKNEKILDQYKNDEQGNVRSDFEQAQVALRVSAENIAIVHRAIEEIGGEMTNDEHTQVLTAAARILAETVATMNASLTVLADCERR